MNNRQLLFLVLLVLVSPAMGQTPVVAVATVSIPGPTVSTGTEIPAALSELMLSSQTKFRQGYEQLRIGNANVARENFDAALNMIFVSGWDISRSAPLNDFFHELIEQIKSAESAYLITPDEADSEDAEDAAEADEIIMSIEDFQDLDLKVALDDPMLRAALGAALRTDLFDVPIAVNDKVASSLDFLLNRGRGYFSDGLVRSGRYRPMMERIFREEGLPLDLISLAHVESSFKPHALSKAQAKGIWQFGRRTGMRYGLKINREIDERSDPEKSTRAAAHYLKHLYELFGNWDLALAAYNCGEGKILRLQQSIGKKDFWELAALPRRLPTETRKHVPLIHASAILTREAGRYGFPSELDTPVQYATITLDKPVNLRDVAKVLGTTYEELKQLNPALRGNRTPFNYPDFALRVPVDSNPELYAEVRKLPVPQVRAVRGATAVDGQHKVVRGDTLYDLAHKYGVSVAALQEANGLSKKSILKIGMLLEIPPVDEKRATESKSRTAKNSPKKR